VARFLADENFSYPVTEELRRLGHDVATMSDLGKANQSVSDEDVLSMGIAEWRTVLSHNRRDSYGFISLCRTTAESLCVRSTLTSFAKEAGSVMPSTRLAIWPES
jgi:hypothetical protein